MEAQLRQTIDVQAQQNQLLQNQLRWFKVGLLTLLLMVAVLIHGIRVVSNERGKSIVVTTEPIIEHPISLADNDAEQLHFPVSALAANETAANQFDRFGNRISVPPMTKAEVVRLNFSPAVSDADRPRRGFDGMCF